MKPARQIELNFEDWFGTCRHFDHFRCKQSFLFSRKQQELIINNEFSYFTEKNTEVFFFAVKNKQPCLGPSVRPFAQVLRGNPYRLQKRMCATFALYLVL